MEDLQRQIRQAIQLDGAEWLQDFIVGCRSESESGRPAEEPSRRQEQRKKRHRRGMPGEDVRSAGRIHRRDSARVQQQSEAARSPVVAPRRDPYQGGERGRERNSPAVSLASSTDSRRGSRQSSGDRATSTRGSTSPLSGSSFERPLPSYYPDQAPIRGQGTRARQPPPPSRAYRHDTREHYLRGARSRSPAQQQLYAPPAPRRLCYVNPRFVGPPSSGGGESSYSYASRASNNRQGKGAKQRQREKARRERYQRKRDREHARLAAEADREPRSASVGNVGDNASGTEHRHQKESYRHATASTTAAAYKDYLRHGRRDVSEERPERGHLGAEHERRALEAPQTSTRQQSPSWGRSPGGRPVRTTTLAEPEDGQADVPRKNIEEKPTIIDRIEYNIRFILPALAPYILVLVYGVGKCLYERHKKKRTDEAPDDIESGGSSNSTENSDESDGQNGQQEKTSDTFTVENEVIRPEEERRGEEKNLHQLERPAAAPRRLRVFIRLQRGAACSDVVHCSGGKAYKGGSDIPHNIRGDVKQQQMPSVAINQHQKPPAAKNS
ncbi:zinc finger CCCH domain-containing protein 13-like [Eleutherodactylus coqui]|uniref:zinc finger CCCH domain-containing protein 13-like n=1 Tax=Eleutherodactylus coqui TaxID=57060 RepID=UPI0034621280